MLAAIVRRRADVARASSTRRPRRADVPSTTHQSIHQFKRA